VIGSLMFKRKIRSAFDMVERGDVDSMMRDFADDVVLEHISAQGVPVTVKGKKATEELYRKFFEEWPKWKFTVKDICIREVFPLLATLTGTSVIMADWSVIQTHKGGKEFKYDGVTAFHVRKGKLIRMSDYYSAVGLPEVEATMKLGDKT